MYISKISISNFRVFDEVGITAFFKKGVNTIISENNCGKTAIIDAIRIAFSTVPYKKDIYFSLSDFHVGNDGKRCSEAMISIYFDDVPPDFFEIWDPEDTSKGEFHVRYYTVKTPEGKEKVRYSIWGGPVEGNPLSADVFESIQLVCLGALRDAETEMRPARSSKLASLFGSATRTEKAKDEIIEILRRANGEILTKEPLIQVGKIVNDNLSTIEQDVLKQRVEFGLVEPRFEAIAAALRAWIKPRWFYIKKDTPGFQTLKDAFNVEEWVKNSSEDETGAFLDVWALKEMHKPLSPEAYSLLESSSNSSFDLFQNGLGYNNIFYMATVLGDMKTSAASSLYNLLLVEEPEAHLHPQLQELVYSFFETNANKESFQVIFTSHSPTLVSRIGIDRIVLLYERNHRVECISLSQSNVDKDDRDNLERYLDVTKSQMLFAKGVLFVEGISEALLLPVFSEYIDRPIDKYAVTIVNVDGVSFKPFASLLCYANNTQQTTIRAAIITDDDRCADKDDLDNYISKDIDYDTKEIETVVSKLKTTKASEHFQNIDNLCRNAHINVYGARKTLEYELASQPDNIPYLLDAIMQVHPKAGKKLSDTLGKLSSDEKKAACLWLFVRERSKYKGEIAQTLASLLKKQLQKIRAPQPGDPAIEKPFVIPEYIKNAIYSVTDEG